ncbi:MAG: glycoside hydrolase family 3 C-terminal domain-containing protein [Chloroflexi bacterium]|nr:glycoside hydrolase family 3 C-terminal domain-containing protein [Chloroflexota bacterium]
MIESPFEVREAELRALLAQLSLDEKVRLMTRVELPTPWEVPRIGLRPIRLSDGPAGVRPQSPDDYPLLTPCETALAASWDPGLLRRIGELVGDEAKRRGVHGLHAPNVNLPRSPLGGRDFEQYSEDPLLSGTLAVAWLSGLQSRRVASVVKHLAANDSETERQLMNSVVNERVLREVYLLPFEMAVQAGAWGTMSAYNRVNGTFCGEQPYLLRQVLKDEWGFDGFVISDAGGTRSTAPAVLAGLDMELPGPGRPQRFGEPLAEAVRAGEVAEEVVDEAVLRILRLAQRAGILGSHSAPEVQPVDDPRGLLREAAAAGFVLLHNDRGLLPLKLKPGETLAVIGPNATEPAYQGGAFSQLPLPDSTETPLSAIRERFSNVNVVHERGAPAARKVPLLREVPSVAAHDGVSPGLTVEYFWESTPADQPLVREVRTSGSMIWFRMPGIGTPTAPGRVLVSGILTPEVSGVHTFVAGSSAGFEVRLGGQLVASQPHPPTIDDMGYLMRPSLVTVERHLEAGVPVRLDVEVRFGPSKAHSFHIGCRPPTPTDLLERAVAAAQTADTVVLVVGETQDSALESADRSTTRLADDQLELIEQVCAANPRTVVVVNAAHAVDMPWAERAAAVMCTWFPGQEFGAALAGVLSGDLEPGGRLPVTFAQNEADYEVFDLTPINHDLAYESEPTIGYRHFLKDGITPRFAFGHGLGYGSFAIENLAVERTSESGARVAVTVRNTSGRAGKEVVQVYVRAPGNVGSGAPELKGFAPVWLEAGESRPISIDLDRRAFRHWQDGWIITPGTYVISVGRSSQDLALQGSVQCGDATEAA